MLRKLAPAFAVAAGSIAALPALPTPASAQTSPPPGSYLQSCRIAVVTADWIYGWCGRDGSGERKAKLNYRFCVGDIANIDGVLFCTIDGAAKSAYEAQHQAALAAENAAAAAAPANAMIRDNYLRNLPAIMGGGEAIIGRGPQSLEEMRSWLVGIRGNAATTGPVQVSTLDIANYLKGALRNPTLADFRREVIVRAFYSVYGAAPGPSDQAVWDARFRAGSSWYIPMMSAETQELNGSEPVRFITVRRAFRAAFGRTPTPAENAEWRAKRRNYSFMMLGLRDYLYSPAGASELAATVRRAIERNTGASATDAQVGQKMAQWSIDRRVYDSMR